MRRVARGRSTCWTEIRGAAAGDAEARAHFVTAYTPVIRAYLLARWRGSPLAQSVDDAMQEVFLSCFREGGVLDRADPERPGGFRAFLYGVARNVARGVERTRGRRREQRLQTNFEAPASDEPSERAFDRAWAVTILREAGQSQERAARAAGADAARRVELLRLRFEEGLPIREIAERWNAEPAHLHHEYARARREFRDALIATMLFHHPDSRQGAWDEARRLLGLLAG